MHRLPSVAATSVACIALAAVTLAGCRPNGAAEHKSPEPSTVPAGNVTAERLGAAEPGEWLTPGGGADGAYHSALATINAGNATSLGFAWEYKLETRRGLEATPVAVDGVLYVSGNFGRVYAVDAATGAQKWVYDPGVDGQWGRYACCDAVNRGVAVWHGRVYVGALDGYLHAIDAATGKRIWKIDTLPVRDGKHPYTVTVAPVVAGDELILGSSGADFDGVRGYVSAFDLGTGALRWRFYTVPRDPRVGAQDQPHLEKALATWDPRHRWESGGGATVWDGISYDPALKLVYFGTGNGAPYDIKEDGRRGGDDLYAASIVAVHSETGELAWYFQTTPGDQWDYDSTQKMILTDLDLGQGSRHVLMQASKNGFYYVLDRATGEVLAAHNYAFVNWTLGLDPVTHRPRPNPAAEYSKQPKLIFPGMAGAHNWQPMSYDGSSKLAFIPAIEEPMVYVATSKRRAGLVEGTFTVPGLPPEGYDPAALKSLFGPLPALDTLARGVGAPVRTRGVLRALDVRSGKIAWEQPSASGWDGGVLSTAGNLVFQGDVLGKLNVYAADSGKLLTRLDVGTSIMAAPMTYSVAGVQYVAVLAGFGGGNMGYPFPPESAAYRNGNSGRLIAFKLGGGAVPTPPALADEPFAKPDQRPTDAGRVARGEVLYNRYCARCHVFGRSVLPDLRRMSPATHGLFAEIVLRGAYRAKGMGRWDDVLSGEDAGAVLAYIDEQAWQAYEAGHSAQH
jgi:quinohemoprotein ethanol dehydrogenase